MSKMITTSLSPNAEADDVRRAFALLLKPHRWRRGRARAKLEKAFAHWLGRDYAFAFESGRSALYIILKTLNLSAGDEVLLQAYTCVAVPDPVLWVGATPVYVDIDRETFNMSAENLEKKITERSRVLIIQHTFGNPADMDHIMNVAKKHDLFVVEDCAHAMGALLNGKLVGTFGDAAFFSFGRDKVVSSVFGGMLTTNSMSVSKRIQKEYDEAGAASLIWIKRQLLHPLWFSLVKKTYGIGSLGKVLAVTGRTLGIFSRSVYKEEKCGKKPTFIGSQMPNALAELAHLQFHKLKRFNEHREMIAHIYDHELRGVDGITLPKWNEEDRHIFLRYTIQSDDAEKIMKYAKGHNVYLGDWYRTPLAPEGADYTALKYEKGSCPTAEIVATKSVNLPTHIGITNDDAKRVAGVVRKALS